MAAMCYFLEKSRIGTSGWLYVVHFPQPDAYEWIEESRLVPTGEVVPLASCLGHDFEISYDRDRICPDAVTGTFRIPGGFWNTFEFHGAAVEELTYEDQSGREVLLGRNWKIPLRRAAGGPSRPPIR